MKTNNINSFYEYLYNIFGIKSENVFMYEILDDKNEVLFTLKIKKSKNIDLKKHFTNATIVNIKNGCIFSINGLNRLIEQESGSEFGNLIYGEYKIDWVKYKNTLILSNKKQLVIKNIKKVKNDLLKINHL